MNGHMKTKTWFDGKVSWSRYESQCEQCGIAIFWEVGWGGRLLTQQNRDIFKNIKQKDHENIIEELKTKGCTFHT